MPIGAIIGTSVISAGVGALSSANAADAQAGAARAAQRQQEKYFGITKETLNPFIQAGYGATSEANRLLGLDGHDPAAIQAELEKLPGYQFALTQGNRAVQSSAAARGLGVSGAAMRGIADYTTGLADSTYGNQFNRVMSLATLGENAAGQLANAAMGTGQGIANSKYNLGNAQAAGYMGIGNAIQGGLNNVSNLLLTNQILGAQTGTDLWGNPTGGGGGGGLMGNVQQGAGGPGGGGMTSYNPLGDANWLKTFFMAGG